MDHLKIRGTIGFDVLNLIGLVGLRLRSQKINFSFCEVEGDLFHVFLNWNNIVQSI